MTTDPVTELHALHVLDVLDAAQLVVDDWRKYPGNDEIADINVDRLEDALTRLDRLEVVAAAA